MLNIKKIIIYVYLLLICFSKTSYAMGEKELYAKSKIGVELTYLGVNYHNLSRKTVLALSVMGIKYAQDEGYFNEMYTKEIKSTTKKIKAELRVIPYGEDRAFVYISGEDKAGCSAFSFKFQAIGSSSISYDLISLSDDEEESFSYAGELILTDEEAILTLKKDLRLLTSGKQGNSCVWNIHADTALVLKILNK